MPFSLAPWTSADIVISMLVGSAVLGYSCTVLLPLLAYALSPLRRMVSVLDVSSKGLVGHQRVRLCLRSRHPQKRLG